MEVIRNGGNDFACEERKQPIVRALTLDFAVEHEPRHVARLFGEWEQSDLPRPERQQRRPERRIDDE